MAETIEYTIDEQASSWLWAGYAFLLLSVLAYIFAEFLAIPTLLIIAMLALGVVMLIAGYASKRKERIDREETKRTFRRREF
jgi:hypothetical protein